MSYRWKGRPYPDYESLPDEAKGIKASDQGVVNTPSKPLPELMQVLTVTQVDPVEPVVQAKKRKSKAADVPELEAPESAE